MPNKELLYQEFGLTLANARRSRRLSQAQLAVKVGLSRTSVTNIECGRQAIQLHQLYLLASILCVDVTSLLPKESPAPTAKSSVIPEDKKTQYIAQLEKAVARARKFSLGNGRGR